MIIRHAHVLGITFMMWWETPFRFPAEEFFFFMRHPEQLALRVTEVERENWCVKIEAGTKKSHLLPQYR